MSFEPGRRLGPYVIESTIGRGAMGTVYRAQHPELRRTVAIKVLDSLAPRLASEGRFRREAMAIGQMRHPNVLAVHDFGEAEGRPYMVLEYAPGGSLADRMHRGVALEDAETLRLLEGIAAGIDYAHSRGVVHRDIKPANVLIAADGTPLLADFGLVKLLDSDTTMTTESTTSGTPAYMAPEQLAGKAGPAADRYSFAMIAYQLLTGDLPFDGGVLEMMFAQAHKEPPPPSSRRPGLPADVDAVLLHALVKDPEQRWTTCGELVDALRKALGGQPVEVPAVASAAAQPVTEEPERRRRRLLPVLAMGVFCASIAGVLGLLALLHPQVTPGGMSFAPLGESASPSVAAGSRPSGSASPSSSPTTARGGSPTPTAGSGATPSGSNSTPPPQTTTPGTSGGTPTGRGGNGGGGGGGGGGSTPTPKPAPSPTPTPAPAPSTPGTPTAVIAVGTIGSATITWTAPSSGASPITKYFIQASNGDVMNAGGNQTSANWSLAAGTYRFRVRAQNASGLGPWSAWSAPAVVL